MSWIMTGKGGWVKKSTVPREVSITLAESTTYLLSVTGATTCALAFVVAQRSACYSISKRVVGCISL